MDIHKEIALKKSSNSAATEKWIATLTKPIGETNRKNVYYVPSTSEELCKYAKIIGNDKYVCALVDTGASVTVLSRILQNV